MKYAQSLRFILLGVTEMCKLENNNIKKKRYGYVEKNNFHAKCGCNKWEGKVCNYEMRDNHPIA